MHDFIINELTAAWTLSFSCFVCKHFMGAAYIRTLKAAAWYDASHSLQKVLLLLKTMARFGLCYPILYIL